MGHVYELLVAQVRLSSHPNDVDRSLTHIFVPIGNAREAKLQAALDAGMDKIVVKPFRFSDLLGTITA